METSSSKPIDDVENRLKEQLKEVCDKNGQETNALKSTPIIHQLGKFYLHVKDLNMISLIQSAALYNAAIIRSSPENQHELEEELKLLCKIALVKAGAKNQKASLIEQAAKVKNQFELLRDNVNVKLKSIPQISESVDEEELTDLQQKKIALVRNLQKYITEGYKQIMAELVEYCQKVLGPAPCLFVVIGMGSISRKEITPYSDFEHIIVLDENNYSEVEMEDVLNYFRWLSVIMHIIVVNMKETVLPSVAISALNDYFHGEKEDDWFYDV